MASTPLPVLSTTRGAALYIGALLGPSLLLLPGLAAGIAGPASILAWIGLLVLSGLLALVFSGLGTLIPSGGGVAAYAGAGLGIRSGRAVAWSFLAGVMFGAPVVCLIGGTYVAALLGGGPVASVAAAALLLVVVVALTLGGARTTATAQLAIVAVLIVLVAVAVLGSAPEARASNWVPFLPHGWASVGSAGSALMLSFVGWEAIAPLTAQLPDPSRQLPRIIGAAFAVTATVYLALAMATIAVLGGRANTSVPLADLLRVAVGSVGPIVAAIAAVALTLAATNAYLAGAAALAADLRAGRRPGPHRSRGHGLQLGIAGTGVLLLGVQAAGLVSTAQLVAIPTALFLTVYVGCTAAATRLLAGRAKAAAAVSCAAVLGVMAFSGWALTAPLVLIVAAHAPRPVRRAAWRLRRSLVNMASLDSRHVVSLD